MLNGFGSGNGRGGGRGMGGGRGLGRGGGRGRNGGFGGGPTGSCICTECGYVIPHVQGVSCTSQVCPKCGGSMTRNIENQSAGISSGKIYSKTESGEKAYIVPELCKGCKVCMPKCPENAMKFENGKVYIIESQCTGCFACMSACPFGAIKSVSG